MKIFSILLLILSLIAVNVAIANAATNPVMVANIACETENTETHLGIISNIDDVENGDEFIAFELKLRLVATGATTNDDLSDITLTGNPTYTNLVLANNTSTQETDGRNFIVEGGFTGGSGMIQVEDLFILKGNPDANFDLKLVSGTLIPKNSTDRISISPVTITIDPSDCVDSTAISTTGITLDLSSSHESAVAGEEVLVTGMIEGFTDESINWTQTSGSQITPSIENKNLGEGKMESDITFTMPESDKNITLKLSVGTEEKSIDIIAGGTVGAGAIHESPESLQAKLEKQRAEAEKRVSETIQTATGVYEDTDGLAQSGPSETLILMILSSLAILGIWKKYHAYTTRNSVTDK